MVIAKVVIKGRGKIDPEAIIDHCARNLAPYKVPKDVLFLDDLPRNAMGKVTKPAVRELFTETP